MKATQKLLAAFIALTFVAGQHLSAQTIKTPAFTQPLVEQWVKAYNESNPESQVSLAAKGTEADIQVVVSHQQEAQLGQDNTVFARYAILPFTTEGSEAAKVFGSKKLSKSKLQHIYFEVDEVDDEFGDYTDANKGMIIYSGNSQSSVANSFAEYFGQSATAFRGKRIQGDDRFVNMAVSRDQKGLAFNALSNLFDLQTRQLREGIQLLELDVKRNLQTALEGENLDQVIEAIEVTRGDAIPTAEVSLSYNGTDQHILSFVNWVVSTGVNFNHQFGLLKYEGPLQANK